VSFISHCKCVLINIVFMVRFTSQLNNVYKTQPKGSDDELSSDESDRDDEMEETLSKKPELNAAIVPHHGCVNRLRFHFVGDKPYVATWSELRKVCIWDLTVPLRVLENVEVMEITFRHVVVFIYLSL
jgi:hypothetical protein